MNDAERLAGYVDVWRLACRDFIALAREITPEDAHRPTDLAGWDVYDNVAHTAHLEAVLAGTPEETIEVPESAHIKSFVGLYTEQGVLARRGRTIGELADELEAAVATRSAALEESPPTDGSVPPSSTPGGVPWSTDTLLGNRPLDVWMHEQDIRRAIDKPGGFNNAASAHCINRLGQGLPMVLGKKVSPPAGTSVVIEVPEAGARFGALVGEDGRAVAGFADSPSVTVTLSQEDFICLAGGRRPVEATSPSYDGDAELGAHLLSELAVTP